MVRSSSMTAHPAIGLLSRDRTCELSPFLRPETGLRTKLEEMGAAVCVDVAGDHGTPCAVGITVETDAGGYWSGHVGMACSSKDLVHDDAEIIFQKPVLKELGRLDDHMRQSMSTTWRDHTMNNIIRLSVRLSYSIPQENPPVERRVRGRCW